MLYYKIIFNDGETNTINLMLPKDFWENYKAIINDNIFVIETISLIKEDNIKNDYQYDDIWNCWYKQC